MRTINALFIRRSFFITGLLLQLTLACYPQKLVSPLFKDGDVVCWIGDSITNGGYFYNFIYLYYATRFPDLRLTFYNCGISGDAAPGVLRRMDSDVLVHKPSWAALMIGMNDVGRNLYADSTRKDPSIDRKRQENLNKYKTGSEAIVKILADHCQIILQKPTIFDQTASIKTENATGVNDALKRCGDQVETLSAKYHTKLVDYWSIMNKINGKLQQSDPAATIIGPDRVHPGPAGHFVMAYQFLKQTGAPAYVAKISVGSDNAKSNQGSINCEIGLQKRNKDSVSFNCLEYSLPFPVWEDAAKVLSWVPFISDLNCEILQIADLPAGSYRLSIDGIAINSYSAADLNKGINLALEKNTPQYVQALKVMDLCMQYRKTEGLLRSLKFVEYNHLDSLKGNEDTAIIRRTLDVNLEALKNSGHYDYYRSQFSTYLANKPKRAATEQRMREIRDLIYQINKPRKHQFKLIKDI